MLKNSIFYLIQLGEKKLYFISNHRELFKSVIFFFRIAATSNLSSIITVLLTSIFPVFKYVYILTASILSICLRTEHDNSYCWPVSCNGPKVMMKTVSNKNLRMMFFFSLSVKAYQNAMGRNLGRNYQNELILYVYMHIFCTH